ncbi:MAG: Type IV pilus biogenesis protein PilP [uncultured Paraburkholderia sp.]|nr:MAG: Type IV pilus biogenesis protein PilP [uncultured Paraburkholderia sp.]CAH2934541.1 MAG: Type IV pilus biogenesis protein PilP [uncultured Paraburkholderia sp.]CAH2936185.1 MAG: Type IV pilus biogenesis protein PilP [uncultured Paraburkholderia sp.]
MSTTIAGFGGALQAGPVLAHWMKRVRAPLHTWSTRRRWAVALLIGLAVFVLGAHGWVVADLGRVEASRAALLASTQRLADAKRALAQLPSLRREAGAARGGVTAVPPVPAQWTSADDVRVVSELAAKNGVLLLAVEPGAESETGAQSEPALQFTARTDFIHLMSFLRGLAAELPVLMVPVDVTIKRDSASLSVSAALRVYSGLHPAPASLSAQQLADASLDSDDEEDVVFFDPFSPAQTQAVVDLPGAAQLHLLGLLHDQARGLALVDTPDGATTVESGQQIGDERFTHFDASGITLAKGDATRTLALAEAS